VKCVKDHDRVEGRFSQLRVIGCTLNGFDLPDFFLLRAVGDLFQRGFVEILGEDLATSSNARGQAKREISIAGAYISDSVARPDAKPLHDLNRPLPRVTLDPGWKIIRRCHLGELPVEQRGAKKTGRDVAGAIDDVQVWRTIHVIELRDFARVGLAV